MKIREGLPEDSAQFLELMKQLDQETEFMLLEPGERTSTPQDMENHIKNLVKSNSLLLLLDDGKQAAGFLSALRGSANRTKHSAYVVTGIRKEYRGKGYGQALFKELDSWAANNGITRLELTVMTHNKRALHLYEKMGFKKEGTLIRSMIVNGAYVDQFCMAKIL
ncbi:GNAT family N-acetyltransferase [Lacrimispora sp. JR3]|uniref:GNAT family N-acetyltransferase n=1 Tax=Lacrimispora sinapis TaxID=3111456 RepID=UPI00374A5773